MSGQLLRNRLPLQLGRSVLLAIVRLKVQTRWTTPSKLGGTQLTLCCAELPEQLNSSLSTTVGEANSSQNTAGKPQTPPCRGREFLHLYSCQVGKAVRAGHRSLRLICMPGRAHVLANRLVLKQFAAAKELKNHHLVVMTNHSAPLIPTTSAPSQ